MEKHSLVLWVLRGGVEPLPDDIILHILMEFYAPFIIAQIEVERFQPFYDNRGKINCVTVSQIEAHGRGSKVEFQFDYVGASRILLDKCLVLDTRVKVGSREMHLTVLDELVKCCYDVPIEKMALLIRGLEWDSFTAFDYIVIDECGIINYPFVPGMREFMERLVKRFQTDVNYWSFLEEYIRFKVRLLTIVAMVHGAENAFVFFLDLCNPWRPRHPWSPDTNHFSYSNIKTLYEKYREKVDRIFVLTFV